MCCCCARPNKKKKTMYPPPPLLLDSQPQPGQDVESAAYYRNVPSARKQPLPSTRPYLWSSAHTDHANQSFHFQGFEPCYIACIKDLEHKIKLKTQSIDIVTGSPGLTDELAPLLLQYSQMVEALQGIECKERSFDDDDHWEKDDVVSAFSGEKRKIGNRDEMKGWVNSRHDLILDAMGYFYDWDFADGVRKRYGSVTSRIDRVLLGLGGGAFLLVPMIIMAKVPHLNARLIIVSIATMLFALTMSLTTTNRDSLVAATAAYAAVMVVYIGTSDNA